MNRRALAYLAGFGCAALLCWASGQALALRQTNADETPAAEKPAAKPCDVAVIDIGKVFKEHHEFKKSMDGLKVEMLKFQAWAKTQQKKLEERGEAAKANLKPGSDEFEKEVRSLQETANELQVEGTILQKKIMAGEHKAYYRAYQDISARMDAYARAKGIRVLLRYNSDPMDPEDRESVVQGVNNSIVYQDNLDITEEIIRRVNNFPDKS